MAQINLKITGMTCNHCVMHVKKALQSVAGVDSVHVMLEPGRAVVSGNTETDALIATVKEAGYDAEIE